MTGVRTLLQALPGRKVHDVKQSSESASVNTAASSTTNANTSNCALFICSCEMDSSTVQLSLIPWDLPGLVALATRCPMSEAIGRHGVYQLARRCDRHTNAHRLRKVIYKAASAADLDECLLPPIKEGVEEVPMVALACGVFKMDYAACTAFFALHAQAPFASCTTFGMDDGMQLFGFSLFQDVLPATAGAEASPCLGDSAVDANTGERKALSALRPLLGGGSFDTHVALAEGPGHVRYLHSARDISQYTSDGKSLLLNTVIEGVASSPSLKKENFLGSGSVVLDSKLCGGWSVGDNAVVLGWRGSSQEDLFVPSDCTLQTLELDPLAGELSAPALVTTLRGNEDALLASFDTPGALFLGKPWDAFWARTGMQPEDLWWPEAAPKPRSHK